jgi:hypothetical protein
MAVLQIIVERPTDMACSFLFSLDCYSKQAGDESHLTQNIPLAHSFHLSFAMFIISYPCKVSSPRNPKHHNKVIGGTTGKPCSWAN